MLRVLFLINIVIITTLVFAFSIKTNFDINNYELKTMNVNEIYNDKELIINVISGDIQLSSADEQMLNLEIKYYVKKNVKSPSKIIIQNNELMIKNPDDDEVRIASVVGTIPPLHNLTVSSVSGETVLSNLNINNLDVTSVSGDVFINSSSINDKIEISSVSGDTNINNILSTNIINIESISGDILIAEVKFPDQCSITSASGDIIFKSVNGNTINTETLSGDIIINSSHISSLNVDTLSGDLSIINSEILNKNIDADIIEDNNNYDDAQ